MSDFTTHTLETVSADGRAPLQQVNKSFGFIPNLMAKMVEAPVTAQAYLSLGKLMSESSFDAAEQQVILLAVSRYHECHYCVAAHSALAQAHNVPSDVVQAIRNDQPIANQQLEALRRFTTALLEQRGWASEAQLAGFYQAGYVRQQVLEVVLGISMKTISNYANHLVSTELDTEFAGFAWETPDRAVA